MPCGTCLRMTPRHLHRRLPLALVLLAAAVVCAACDDGGGSGPSPDESTSVPSGDATGTAATGSWEADTLVLDCQGACPIVFGAATCDVGDGGREEFELTQTDGSLKIDADDRGFPSRLTGGLYTDGTFEVGGYSTELSGAVEIVAMAAGRIDGDHLEAIVQSWGTGEADGRSIDCHAEIEIIAERE